MNSVPTGSVRIIFCVRAVGDNKNLDILKQTTSGEEAVALIAVDLIERLAYGNAAALELDMYHRQTVDKDSDIIAVIVLSALALADLILIDDLNKIVVDVLLVDQSNVFACTVITAKHLNIILLELSRFFRNVFVIICDAVAEKPLPLSVGKVIII